MNAQILKAKELLKKAKELKNELKFDISSLSDEIDAHVELIGNHLVLDSLKPFQSAHIANLELQLKQAKLEREKAVQELTGKVINSEENIDVFKKVQKVLDAKLEQLTN